MNKTESNKQESAEARTEQEYCRSSGFRITKLQIMNKEQNFGNADNQQLDIADVMLSLHDNIEIYLKNKINMAGMAYLNATNEEDRRDFSGRQCAYREVLMDIRIMFLHNEA